jgi:hypothetical protein
VAGDPRRHDPPVLPRPQRAAWPWVTRDRRAPCVARWVPNDRLGGKTGLPFVAEDYWVPRRGSSAGNQPSSTCSPRTPSAESRSCWRTSLQRVIKRASDQDGEGHQGRRGQSEGPPPPQQIYATLAESDQSLVGGATEDVGVVERHGQDTEGEVGSGRGRDSSSPKPSTSAADSRRGRSPLPINPSKRLTLVET